MESREIKELPKRHRLPPKKASCYQAFLESPKGVGVAGSFVFVSFEDGYTGKMFNICDVLRKDEKPVQDFHDLSPGEEILARWSDHKFYNATVEYIGTNTKKDAKKTVSKKKDAVASQHHNFYNSSPSHPTKQQPASTPQPAQQPSQQHQVASALQPVQQPSQQHQVASALQPVQQPSQQHQVASALQPVQQPSQQHQVASALQPVQQPSQQHQVASALQPVQQPSQQHQVASALQHAPPNQHLQQQSRHQSHPYQLLQSSPQQSPHPRHLLYHQPLQSIEVQPPPLYGPSYSKSLTSYYQLTPSTSQQVYAQVHHSTIVSQGTPEKHDVFQSAIETPPRSVRSSFMNMLNTPPGSSRAEHSGAISDTSTADTIILERSPIEQYGEPCGTPQSSEEGFQPCENCAAEFARLKENNKRLEVLNTIDSADLEKIRELLGKIEELVPSTKEGHQGRQRDKKELYPGSGLYISATRLAAIKVEAKKDCLRLFHLLFDEVFSPEECRNCVAFGKHGKIPDGKTLLNKRKVDAVLTYIMHCCTLAGWIPVDMSKVKKALINKCRARAARRLVS
ncbi:unnamed protein product [Knipowitschia caucasica]